MLAGYKVLCHRCVCRGQAALNVHTTMARNAACPFIIIEFGERSRAQGTTSERAHATELLDVLHEVLVAHAFGSCLQLLECPLDNLGSNSGYGMIDFQKSFDGSAHPVTHRLHGECMWRCSGGGKPVMRANRQHATTGMKLVSSAGLHPHSCAADADTVQASEWSWRGSLHHICWVLRCDSMALHE